MKCPVCPGTELLMTVREGIEIDYCPKCRGVWLDRGELDQIIRRASQATLAEAADEKREPYRQHDHDERDRRLSTRHDEYRHGAPHDRRGHVRKKKSFLGDLFDFD
jgi:uncharacterized protein